MLQEKQHLLQIFLQIFLSLLEKLMGPIANNLANNKTNEMKPGKLSRNQRISYVEHAKYVTFVYLFRW